MSDLSTLKPVALDQGKAQWVQGILTGIAKDNPIRTHTVGVSRPLTCVKPTANHAPYFLASPIQKVAA